MLIETYLFVSLLAGVGRGNKDTIVETETSLSGNSFARADGVIEP